MLLLAYIANVLISVCNNCQFWLFPFVRSKSSPKREERRLQIFILPKNLWWLEQTTSTRRLCHFTRRSQEPAGSSDHVNTQQSRFLIVNSTLWVFSLAHSIHLSITLYESSQYLEEEEGVRIKSQEGHCIFHEIKKILYCSIFTPKLLLSKYSKFAKNVLPILVVVVCLVLTLYYAMTQLCLDSKRFQIFCHLFSSELRQHWLVFSVQ